MTPTSEASSYSVAYLHTLSLFPDRFYAQLNGLTGRDATWKNPGTSLRSHLVAKCLRFETVVLEGQVLEAAKECYEFTASTEVASKVYASLMEDAVHTTTSIVDVDDRTRADILPFVLEMQALADDATEKFRLFHSSESESSMIVPDIFAIEAVDFRQAVYLLQDKINEVREMIENAPAPKEVA